MFTLLPLLVILGIVILWAMRPHGAPSVSLPAGASPLDHTLRRWVAAGLISSDQADAISAHERPATVGAPRRRLPVAMEALGYLGGILGLVGAVLLVAPAWDELGFAARLAILGGSSAGFLVAGTALRTEGSAALERLREFLWLLATGATTGALVVVGVDGIELSERGVAQLAAAGAGVLSLALWRLRDRPLQHLTTFVAVAVLASSSASYGDDSGLPGLAIFAVGALWLVATRFALVPPPLVGAGLGVAAVFVGCTTTAGSWPAVGGLLLVVAGAVALVLAHVRVARPDTAWVALGGFGALVGAALVVGDWQAVAPLLGLAIAATLAGTGITQRERAAGGVQLALGIIGLFAFLPWTMLYFFGDALGPPAVLLITGAVLLLVAVVVLRRQGGTPSGTAGPAGVRLA